MEEGKKVSLFATWLTRRSRVRGGKKMRASASYSMSSKFMFIARHTLTTALQECL